MAVIREQPLLERLDHIADNDARGYALGLLDEHKKIAVEQHITLCSTCLMKLRIAVRASA